MSDAQTKIQEIVSSSDVVLFMKGKRRMPQCGFSAQVVSVLDRILPEYKTVNVLESPEIREGVKEFSSWPTIPQLYVKGKFLGGCDIVTEMFEQGQLVEALGADIPEAKAPNLEVTASAAEALRKFLASEAGEGAAIRFEVSPTFKSSLGIDTATPLDVAFEVAGGVPFVVGRLGAERTEGVTIDFVAGLQGGFRINNPNEPAKTKPMSPAELKAKLDAKDEFFLVDVRGDGERELASIPGAIALDDEREKIEALDKSKAVLVFMCHGGIRSQAAADEFVSHGFKNVYNLEGGIDAYSKQVDSSIPEY